MSNETDVALRELATSTAEAVAGVLRMFMPDGIELGEAQVVEAGTPPLDGVSVPAVVADVSYTDGASGGNLFVTSVNGVKKLAAAMMGTDAVLNGEPLDEMERSAVAEAMNQMMASAAGATSAVLGTEVEIGVPETRTFSSTEQALAAYARTPHATSGAVTVCGEPCRLVQLVPNAFVVRMTRAFDEIGTTVPTSDATQRATGTAGGAGTPSLAGIPVRVWAELGRAQLPSAHVVGLPTGAVVELDKQADEPIDLYVNGRRFATGRLVVADGADWAVRIEHVLGPDNN
jgi:flagellar motor switch protein FliN/FliY